MSVRSRRSRVSRKTAGAYVTPGYFTTLRIPILLGRGFETTDTPESEYVAVINVGFAHRYFGDSSPIGYHIQCSGKTYRVVGMVSDVAKKPGEEGNEPIGTERAFYIPAVQANQEMEISLTYGSNRVGSCG